MWLQKHQKVMCMNPETTYMYNSTAYVIKGKEI